MIILLVFFIIILTTLMSEGSQWKLIEKSNSNLRQTYHQQERTNPNNNLELVVFVKQNSIEDLANDIANPNSPNYGKHLSKSEVNALTANPEATEVVKKYLADNHLTIKEVTNNGAYITATGTALDWENALNTHFHDYVSDSGEKLIRTHQYFLPDNVSPYVTGIMNTIQFPMIKSPGPVKKRLGPVVSTIP